MPLGGWDAPRGTLHEARRTRLRPETRDPKPENRNPKPETRGAARHFGGWDAPRGALHEAQGL